MPTSVALALIGVPAAFIAFAIYLKICARWPWRNCRTCNGSGKRRNPFGLRTYRLCGKCGATGREVRPGRRLYEHVTNAARLEGPGAR